MNSAAAEKWSGELTISYPVADGTANGSPPMVRMNSVRTESYAQSGL